MNLAKIDDIEIKLEPKSNGEVLIKTNRKSLLAKLGYLVPPESNDEVTLSQEKISTMLPKFKRALEEFGSYYNDELNINWRFKSVLPENFEQSIKTSIKNKQAITIRCVVGLKQPNDKFMTIGVTLK